MSQSPDRFIDPTAEIGEHTVIWHYARILADVKIGDHCSVGGGTEIGRGTVIGNYSRISANVFLPSNTVIGDRVFVGPGVVATDDKDPRAGNFGYDARPPVIEDGASIGAGAILLPGVRIGVGAMIGAGAIVTRDVGRGEHVRGEPARVKPYSKIQSEVNYDIYSPEIRERLNLA